MNRKKLKPFVPKPIWDKLGSCRRAWLSRHDKNKSTREVFSQIYSQGMWGADTDGGFSSGLGSEAPAIVEPYIAAVNQWADGFHAEKLHALDLGCGDFRVGRKIHHRFARYTGADIVPQLISKHEKEFDEANLDFICLDAISEEIPDADVVFVRQVLQHLSNDQVQQILGKLKKFKHLIVTEHVPAPDKLITKNADKIHGGGIRVPNGSGIYLDAPPFSMTFLESKIIAEVPGGENPSRDGMIVTTWYQMH